MQSPLRLSAEDEPVWLDEADVVIIGLGGAGVCAAIEALDAGSSVIAIDRFSGGGATRMSGGVVYAGGGTSMQRDANVTDDPANMRRYLKLEVEDAVSDATLDRFCENSPGLIDWLERQGVGFDSSLAPEKTSYPADGHYLYFSGNEAQALYAKHARPAQRGHRVFGKGLTGKNLFDTLRATAIQKGLRIYTHSEVNRLVVSEQGAVAGVIFERVDPASRAARKIDALQLSFARSTTLLFPKIGEQLKQRTAAAAQKNSVTGAISAKKGVILAAGGFIQNREMVRHYAPKYSGATPLGSMGCDGSGIRLGQSVGAMVDRMERISAWRQFLPPKALAQGIVVDGQGRRLIAEDSYGGTTGYMIAEKAAGRAFIIIDSALYKQVIRQAMPGKGKLFRIQGAPALMALLLSSHRGRTLAALAEKCGMDPALLENSVEQYNIARQVPTMTRSGKIPPIRRRSTIRLSAPSISRSAIGDISARLFRSAGSSWTKTPGRHWVQTDCPSPGSMLPAETPSAYRPIIISAACRLRTAFFQAGQRASQCQSEAWHHGDGSIRGSGFLRIWLECHRHSHFIERKDQRLSLPNGSRL